MRLLCGRCHSCGSYLQNVLDGEEYCQYCGQYRRYPSHGWTRSASADLDFYCPDEAALDKIHNAIIEEQERIRSRF